MIEFQLKVNGEGYRVQSPTSARLLDVLRETLQLKGAREGCQNRGECGACAVFLDNKLVYSCMVPMAQVIGYEVKTIEGMANKTELSRIQESFVQCGVQGCGFCLPGMVLASLEVLKKTVNPTDREIQDALVGHHCDCGQKSRIVAAIKKSAKPR